MIGEITVKRLVREQPGRRSVHEGSATWGSVSRGTVLQSINFNNASIINEYVSIIGLPCKGCFLKEAIHCSFCTAL